MVEPPSALPAGIVAVRFDARPVVLFLTVYVSESAAPTTLSRRTRRPESVPALGASHCALASVVCASLASYACRAAPTPPPAPRFAIVAASTPQQVLDQLERRLLEQPWTLAFETDSRGFVDAHFVGSAALVPGARLELDAKGAFLGKPKELRLVANADFLQACSTSDGINDKVESACARPTALDEAVVVGFTHMGLLHNLAMLCDGKVPDHCDGGVREWVSRIDLKLSMPEPLDGRQVRKLSYGVVVQGRRSAEIELWLAVDDGLPVKRTVVVQFPDGEMQVDERYAWNAR